MSFARKLGREMSSRSMRLVLLTCAVLCCGRRALALDPSMDISQYAHTALTNRDSFATGTVFSIAQTPDGYLWLGTQSGLFRFDGVRAIPWQPPGQQSSSTEVTRLLVTRDGTLWVGTTNGLGHWAHGSLSQVPELAGYIVLGMLEAHDGTVWIGAIGRMNTAHSMLCEINEGRTRCYDVSDTLRELQALYQDSRGDIWLGAGEGSLWLWKTSGPQRYAVSREITGITGFVEDDRRVLLMATSTGLMQWLNGRAESYVLPGLAKPFHPECLFRSSDGSLWIGTVNHGLIHIHQGKSDLFSQADGLSGDYVTAIFEDREGDVWVGTTNGLDRFHDLAVPMLTTQHGLPDPNTWSVLAARDGAVWIGSTSGVTRWKEGQITIYRAANSLGPATFSEGTTIPRPKGVRQITDSGLRDRGESLFEDDAGAIWVTTSSGVARLNGKRFDLLEDVPGIEVYGIAQDRQPGVWFSSRDNGLYRVQDRSVVEQIPWSDLGHHDFAVAMVPDASRGGLWLGFGQGGVAYFDGHQIRNSYSVSDGLGRGRVADLRFEPSGALWAATEGGLSRILDGHITTLTTKNGLPCDTVDWSIEDDDHFVWVYMPCGLARLARSELDAWFSDPTRRIRATVFDSSDGVRLAPILGVWGPRSAKSTDGKLWFTRPDGASFVDPRHLPFNKIPPPVHVEQITADHKTYQASFGANEHLHLPPLVRDLEIDYTALSFVAPEKVQFRYKLEGRDRAWEDVGNRRQAFYRDLPPGSYRFRVIASNNSGVWNEEGAALVFAIAPTYYQTNWFRLLCVTAFLTLLWTLYQFRLRQLAHQFNMRLEERVNERTRIARELHDTLLQNLHGLLFRFQAARNMLPRRTEEAMEALDGAINRTEQAIAESRDTIKDLRYERVTSTDLAELLTQTGRELESGADANANPPIFRVIVEGERQPLSPVLQDEVYRIARELLRNAFQHAHARHIEAEIRYDHHLLRVLIRDDGKGMDPKILKEGGQPGHWGLPGVRERAKQIGARLEFWSEGGAGTEVQLTVPVSVSSERPGDGSRFQLFGRSNSS